MAAESKLQTRIRQDLELKGWYVVKTIMCNKPGFPDLTCLKDGLAIFIEVKDEGEEAEPLQKLRHSELRVLGFHSRVIDTWEKYLQLREELFNLGY